MTTRAIFSNGINKDWTSRVQVKIQALCSSQLTTNRSCYLKEDASTNLCSLNAGIGDDVLVIFFSEMFMQ